MTPLRCYNAVMNSREKTFEQPLGWPGTNEATNKKPGLIVFDLDFTLWDCGGTWCDCTRPPYRKNQERLKDSVGRIIELYPDVRSILKTLKEAGIQIAAASRTHEPDWAAQILKLLQVDAFFDFREIYPGPKQPHFQSLQKRSGIPFDRMVFFDDERRNIADISALGVTSVLVEEGVQWKHLVPWI